MPSEDLLRHTGVVQALNGDRATVAVAAQGCSGCGKRSACGVGKLAGERKFTLIEIAARPGLRVGENVTLEIEQGAIHRGALIAYLLPALTLIGGAVTGNQLAGDAGAALGALGGLASGLGFAAWRARRAPTVPRLQREN